MEQREPTPHHTVLSAHANPTLRPAQPAVAVRSTPIHPEDHALSSYQDGASVPPWLHRMFRDRSLAWLTALAVVIPAPESKAATAAPATTTSSEASEEIRIETQDGLMLGADFYEAKRTKERAPAVLIVHAPGRDRSSVAPLAETLSKKGFAVLALDLRGHGASAAGQAWEELDRAAQERMWTFTQRDLDAAAVYLRGRRDIHTTNLSVVGVGASCALALRHASEDENSRAVVLLDPTDDQLGFNLADEVRRCGGLPTMVVSPHDARARTRRLVEGLQSAGFPEIELSVLRSAEEGYLEDKKMSDKVTSYLRETVVEAKGR